MTEKLVAEEGDLKGLVLEFESGEEWIIGRDPEECQMVVADPLVSRRHLLARRTPEGIVVENLSQTNPILINQQEILDQPRLLQEGDQVKIGNEVFSFHTNSSPSRSTNQEPSPYPETSDKNQPAPNEADFFDEGPDTIFDLEGDNTSSPALAEINFGINELGRWLLKVIGGPNNGAEFYMQTGHSYVLGTDPHSCDIVFHDTSVSRQHARLTVTNEDTLLIEDLRSRNGVVVNGLRIEGQQSLSPNVIITMGTTSFVVYDREGEMQTIISPLLPSIVKVLQQEESNKPEKTAEAPSQTAMQEESSAAPPAPEPLSTPAEPKHRGHWVLISVLIGLLTLGSLATISLFKGETIKQEVQENGPELIRQALAPFPAVKFSFNPGTGNLLLLGHVSTSSDKSQLLYGLQSYKFIKTIDDTGLIMDEGVWKEINSVLTRNPAWQGITVHSPAAGQFVLSGYLQTRKQAEQLSDYISVNFPYLDLLKNQVVVEEDVLSQINVWAQELNLRTISVKMANGEITFTGSAPSDRIDAINQLVQRTKEIPGVRLVNNLIRTQAPELGIINITDQYQVTGQSKLGNKYTVVVNGRILSEGDIIDGMTITSIRPNMVLLEKDGTTYRIDYNK